MLGQDRTIYPCRSKFQRTEWNVLRRVISLDALLMAMAVEDVQLVDPRR